MLSEYLEIVKDSNPQSLSSGPAASASPENVLERQIHGPHPDLLNHESLCMCVCLKIYLLILE